MQMELEKAMYLSRCNVICILMVVCFLIFDGAVNQNHYLPWPKDAAGTCDSGWRSVGGVPISNETKMITFFI